MSFSYTFPDEDLFVVSVQTPWFADTANYLETGKIPNHLSPHEKRRIIVQSSNYSWVDNALFHSGPDIIIRRCVREDEMTDILHACHDGPCGGHFYDKRTSYKVLHSGYYWPSVFKMLPNMLKDVIVVKEWVDLRHLIKCRYNPKS